MKRVLKIILLLFVLGSISLVTVIFLELKYQAISPIYNKARPMLLTGGGEKCLNELKQTGSRFTVLGDIPDGNICVIKNAVKIERFSSTKLSPGPITLNCKTALKFQELFRQVKATSVTHMGAYNCRKQRGNNVMSEHSFGTALDIAVINGASVTKDWGKNTEKGKYLKKVNEEACSLFSNVLNPESNKLHYDHFHIDQGPGFGCTPNWFNELQKNTVRTLNSVARRFN